jgi:ABC-2 type transport system permease protein
MTAATAERAATATPTSGSRFTGVGTLVRFLLRRDRIKLPAWTGGLGLFVLYLAAALPNVAGTEEDLRGASQLFNDPVGRLMVGPGYGFDEPTIERFVANGYGLYFALLAALMSILLVVRHTRLEEQTGRAELIRADRVGRSAPLTATVIVAVITNLVGGLLVFAMLVGYAGFAVRGSLVFAAAIVATGLAFAGVTTITVQLSQYSPAAAGMAGGVLGLAYLLRAGGDMAERGGTALSWTSPLAWPQQTAPFVLDRWWPLALSLGFAVVTTAIGFVLAERRDLGASWFATRPGAAQGPRRSARRSGSPSGSSAPTSSAGACRSRSVAWPSVRTPTRCWTRSPSCPTSSPSCSVAATSCSPATSPTWRPSWPTWSRPTPSPPCRGCVARRRAAASSRSSRRQSVAGPGSAATSPSSRGPWS